MSNFKTYCRLIDYLDATDTDLAQLVRGTCVDLTLGSTKGKPGITLLIPDKEYRAKITKLAYSSDPAEATQACDMLNALILRDVFKSGADFMAKRANIPNSLYPSQHVGVKDVKGNSVTFESGAVATLDTKFADSSKKKNLAVWHMKGEIPVTSDRPAKIERGPMRGPTKGAKGGKHGGYDQGVAAELSKNLRWKIAVAIENEYSLSLLQRQTGGRVTSDPFVRCAMSLVEYLNEKAPQLLQQALPLLSLSKADFYFLIEPHRDGDDHLIPASFIQDWWAQRASHSTGAGCKILDGLLTSAGNGKDLPEIDRVRKDLLQRCNDRKCVETVEKVYTAKYGDAAELKLLQDELRFLIHCSFEELEAGPYDGGKLSEIVNMIGEYMNKMAGGSEERKSGRKVFNAATLKYSIAPSDKIETIKCFINSTYFMFTPLSAAESRAVAKSHIEMPAPGAKGVWNIIEANQQKYSTHSRIAETGSSAELEAALKEVDSDLAERIRAAFAKK